MTARPVGIRWIAIAWAASAILSVTAHSFGATTRAQQPADPKQQMVAVLWAPGPHASLGDEARTWDRFVGTWDCDFSFYLEDGSVRHSPGELEFGWVLDGRAVQDLWITYPKQGETERGIGTSIRFFDDKSKTWKDDSFTWRGEKSRDGGKTWKLEEEHRMKRRSSGQVKVGG